MMAYSNKLVCSVKVNNKILREKVESGISTVWIPFGSEYSILVKNLAGRNAVVHLEIDGKSITTDKSGILLSAGRETELKGFIEGVKTNRRFKFIEKTEEISDYRGDRIDDGMIRVTWQFEKPAQVYTPVRQWIFCNVCRAWHYDDEPCRSVWTYEPHIVWTKSASTDTYGGLVTSCYYSSVDTSMRSIGTSANNDGITVEGSKTHQSFYTTSLGDLETEVHSMVIVMKGYKGSIKVEKPILVNTKKRCPSCGRMYSSKFEFCPNDGTALK
jgi:hypothetical protein